MSYGLPTLTEWAELAPVDQQQIAVERAPLALSVALARITTALVVAYRSRRNHQVVADAQAIVREAMVEIWRLIEGEA